MKSDANQPTACLRRGLICVRLCAIGLLAFTGCEARPATAPLAAAASAESRLEPADGTASSGDTSNANRRETWDAQFIRGVKVGYVHTVRRTLNEAGQTLFDIASTTHLKVARDGQTQELEIKISEVETAAGKLVRFATETQLGTVPIVVRGIVHAGRIDLDQQQGKRTTKIALPWSDDMLGFFGAERSLERQPLEPGEKRTLKILMPIANVVVDETLQAVAYEETPLLAGSVNLLRIEGTSRMPDGTELQETYWTDRSGQVQKTRVAAAEQESYRCSRAEALADSAKPALDLIRDVSLRPSKPLLPAVTKADRATYIIRLKQGDPAKIFANGATQLVEPIDGSSARLTVWAAGPTQLPRRASLLVEPQPGPEYLAASNLLQTDDEQVRALAAKVTAGAPQSAERAVALEKAVHELVVNKNYSQAFGSAAEVARSREGDCTEHAVLLAALARAAGIPSRVAVGLVYVPGMQAFAFHMWTEVYLTGHWLPLDATRGRGGTDATYLKVTDSSLKDDAPFDAFLRVAQLMGQSSLEPVDAE